MYKAVIFDFDGTICDTGKGIKSSAKYALEKRGYTCPPFEELDFFIGPPLLNSFCEHFGADEAEGRELIKEYRVHYSETGLFDSELYDGICDMLRALKNDGIKVGIASSKPVKFINILLEHFGISELFDAVCGVELNADTEKKSSVIKRCLDALGETAENVLVAGDRNYDINGAAENNIEGIGVLWGYGSREEFISCGARFIAEKPHDIESIALCLFEQTTKVNTLLNGRVLHMHVDEVLLSNGKTAGRECVDHPGGVAVIGLTDEDEVLLVRQFRYPYKETIYEIPAGKVEKGEDPFLTGQREFKEECGAVAGNYFSLGEIYPSPGYTDEIIRLFGATDISFEEQELDDDEFLEVHKMKFDELIKRIMSGEIKDAKTVSAAFKLKEYLKRN